MLKYVCAIVLSIGFAILPAAEGKPFYQYDFEPRKAKETQPGIWTLKDGVTWVKERRNSFLRVNHVSQTVITHPYVRIPLPQPKLRGANGLKLEYLLRYNDIQSGKEKWNDGRIMMHFLDKDFQKVGKSPRHPSMRGTKSEWEKQTQEFKFPAEAAYLEIMPALFFAAAGQIDIDNVQLRYCRIAE